MYLILEVWQGTDTRNRLFYRELDTSKEFTELISDLEASYQFIGNDGPEFFIHTNYQTPRSKLITIDTRNPEKTAWKTIIPENGDAVECIKLGNNQFIVIYLHNAYHQVKRFDTAGNFLGEIALPMIGSILSLDHEAYLFGNRFEDELYFTFNSFIHLPTVLQYSFEDNRCGKVEEPTIEFDYSRYNTDQVFVKSKDGTRIPMFMVHNTDVPKNKKNSALLYGYGGFNISLTPNFLISRLVWLELGGTLAVANLRGGGEYGEDWHQSGSLQKKNKMCLTI